MFIRKCSVRRAASELIGALPDENQTRRGVKTKIIKPQGSFIMPQDFEKNISPKTKVISVSFVNYASGYQADLKSIAKLCKSYNITFVVDGSQGVN